MRHFDVANRDRDYVTIIGSITPAAYLTTSLSIAAGKDDYLESEFGLRDNTHTVHSAGADVVGGERVNVGVSVLVRGVRRALPIAPGQSGRAVHRPVPELGRRQRRSHALRDRQRRRDANRREGGPAAQLLLLGYLYRPYTANPRLAAAAVSLVIVPLQGCPKVSDVRFPDVHRPIAAETTLGRPARAFVRVCADYRKPREVDERQPPATGRFPVRPGPGAGARQ